MVMYMRQDSMQNMDRGCDILKLFCYRRTRVYFTYFILLCNVTDKDNSPTCLKKYPYAMLCGAHYVKASKNHRVEVW